MTENAIADKEVNGKTSEMTKPNPENSGPEKFTLVVEDTWFEVELALFTQYSETKMGNMFLCVEPAQVNERGDRSNKRPCRVS